jgi:hypothetical protein
MTYYDLKGYCKEVEKDVGDDDDKLFDLPRIFHFLRGKVEAADYFLRSVCGNDPSTSTPFQSRKEYSEELNEYDGDFIADESDDGDPGEAITYPLIGDGSNSPSPETMKEQTRAWKRKEGVGGGDRRKTTVSCTSHFPIA